ncbi:wall-associated receptor kinase 2 isoform X2 [Setaria viridis]|uniref:wall-associated receptor kinase 2 isoform X2 n=1 Tax=Setaria viridis TaxID=4556 RepID=UPI003B3AC438
MEKVGSSVGVVALAAAIATLLLPPFAAAAATGPGSSCTRSCGNITIPYPFGVEPGCYHAGFNLTCRSGAGGQGSPQLFLGDGTVQVLEISVQHNTVRINSTGMILPFNDGGRTKNGTWGSGLPRSGPYFLSETINRLLVLGCNTQVTILGGDDNNLISMNANLQTFMFAMAIARIHQEVSCASALLVIRAMLPFRMDAET